MKKVSSNITNLVHRFGKLLNRETNSTIDCEAAQDLMSPFIDSMATANEIDRLQGHLDACAPCQRQLQSFISVRSLLARVEQPVTPEDFVLDTRVKLSQERHKNSFEKFENRLSNALKPLAIPAIGGVSVTMILFGFLLGATISNSTVMANDRVLENGAILYKAVWTPNLTMIRSGPGSAKTEDDERPLYKPVRTTDRTMIRFAASDSNDWIEPLMIETHVGDDGKVLDYRIISGPETLEVRRFVREQLSLAQFTPAMAFGRPVDSKIILSFVAVKS